MKVIEVNATSMCPTVGRFLPRAFPSNIICHCLIIESSEGLILVDTGMSLDTLYQPQNKLGLMNYVLNIEQRPELAIINQLRALGYSPRDVRHIIPTHLDNDHCEAIVDFPLATVHTSMLEINNARNPQSANAKARYLNFQEHRNWKIHAFTEGENWYGFKGVKAIEALEDNILLVPLYGHTPGHFGVAVKSDRGWLLHAGDSYYDRRELVEPKSVPRGTRMFVKMIHENFDLAQKNLEKLRALNNKEKDIQIICSHDPSEFPCLCH